MIKARKATKRHILNFSSSKLKHSLLEVCLNVPKILVLVGPEKPGYNVIGRVSGLIRTPHGRILPYSKKPVFENTLNNLRKS